MLRREWFKRVIGLGVTASVLPATPAISPDPEWQPHLDYFLSWSGWHRGIGHPWMASQWVALPAEVFGTKSEPIDYSDCRPYLYVCAPGMIGGPYYPGACFDLTHRNRMVFGHTPEEERTALMVESHAYITRLVETYRESTYRDLARTGAIRSYQFPGGV